MIAECSPRLPHLSYLSISALVPSVMFCLNSCAIAMIVTQVRESFPWLFSWPFSHIMLLIVSKILQDFLFEQEMFTLTTTFASYVSQNRFMKKEDREIKNSEGLRPQDIFKCQNSIEQN